MNPQEHEHDQVSAFDTLFTTNHIQMMKIIMPFLDASRQRSIAVYIKYMELQYTISYFQKHTSPPFPIRQNSGLSSQQSSQEAGMQVCRQVCREIMPYCSPEEKKKMEQVENLFSAMKNYQEMMEMFSMMKEIFPEGEGGMNPDMLSGLLGQDASQFLDLFRNMNPT